MPSKTFSLLSIGLSTSFIEASSSFIEASKPTVPEIWSAFFAFNTTSSCGQDYVGTQFWSSRFSPLISYDAFTNEAYDWPTLTPIHSKTITFSGGETMAADPIGRRAWGLFGTTDWASHTWIVQFSFPKNNFNSSKVVGVCEFDKSINIYLPSGLTYNSNIVKGGAPFIITTNQSMAYNAGNITAISVPPLNDKATSVPLCGLKTVSVIQNSAFIPNQFPLPIPGTDKKGNPLILEVNRSPTNSSQISIIAFSALTGNLVYNQTWACGYPSYLYSCPPTNGMPLPNGLQGFFLQKGVTLFGGGAWGSAQWFQGILPALALEEEEEEERTSLIFNEDTIPVFTYVNVSSNQGTWFYNANMFLNPNADGPWPLTVQYIPAGGGTCAQPSSWGGMISTTISEDGWFVNSTSNGNVIPVSCPFRQQDIPTWYSSSACAGASYAFPDNLYPQY